MYSSCFSLFNVLNSRLLTTPSALKGDICCFSLFLSSVLYVLGRNINIYDSNTSILLISHTETQSAAFPDAIWQRDLSSCSLSCFRAITGSSEEEMVLMEVVKEMNWWLPVWEAAGDKNGLRVQFRTKAFSQQPPLWSFVKRCEGSQ